MEVKLRYPYLTWGVLGACALVCIIYLLYRIWLLRRTVSDHQKKRYHAYGAMWLVEKIPGYRSRKIMYSILNIAGVISIIVCILSAGVMLGRPGIKEKTSDGVKKRDIYLCMDVSYSLYALNLNFVENLEKVVKKLDGDRIGICIYNTSSIVYMPLTDDTDFAVSKLEELKVYFADQKEYQEKYGDMDIDAMTDADYENFADLSSKLGLFEAGTTLNAEEKGSSLIGEGLASCLYDFPSLDDSERTRVIILVTDNAENSFETPAVDLSEAVSLCAKNKVTVFGIFPPKEMFDVLGDELDYTALQEDMQAAVERTGGSFYVAASDFETGGIIGQIQANEALQVSETAVTKVTDVPQTAFLVCMVSLLVFALIKAGGV